MVVSFKTSKSALELFISGALIISHQFLVVSFSRQRMINHKTYSRGEIIYETLHNASKVLLDCKNHQIIVLEHKKHDEYIEQKKIYKSLGYINDL